MTDDSSRPPPAPNTSDTPYVGLVPYGEANAAFFFGRDEESRIVAGNLRASALTLLYGASGVGKTSLLRAGAIHELHELARGNAGRKLARTRFAVCAFAAWRDDPLPGLMEAIRASASEELGADGLRAWAPGEPPADTLRAWTERVRTLLVVLDQFEDYFLYHPAEDGEGTFAGEFPEIVNDPESPGALPRSRSARTRWRSSTASKGRSRASSRTTCGSSISAVRLHAARSKGRSSSGTVGTRPRTRSSPASSRR